MLRHHGKSAHAVPLRLILFFQFAALIAREFVRRELDLAGFAAYDAAHLSALAGFAVFGVLVSPLWRRIGPLLATAWHPAGASMPLVVVAVAAGLLMRLAAWTLALSFEFLDLPGRPAGALVGWRCPPALPFLFGVGVMAVATPLVEETVNRGLILGELRAREVRFAIVISALVFAAFHVTATMPIAFLFGIVAARLAICQGTLWGAGIAHATFNAAFLVDSHCLQIAWQPQRSFAAAFLCLAATAVLVLLALQAAGARGAGPRGPGRAGIASP